MTTPQLAHRQELVVALDYGQFYLHTADNDPELAISLLEEAQDADGVAQADALIVIESPHQNSFEMPLTVEVWDGQPAEDLDLWQEAFEAHLRVSDRLLYESPTVDVTELDVPSGTYRALITGRGFVAHGWPGSTDPGDEWRIRLWPSNEAIPPRRVKRWIDETGTSAEPGATRAEKPQAKRVFDMTDPTRRELIERIETLTIPPPAADADMHVDPTSEMLDATTIFRVAPSQLRLVLEGPDIESIDPHGYLRRTRQSIASLVGQLSDDRARPLRDLDALINDSLAFDAAERARAGLTPR